MSTKLGARVSTPRPRMTHVDHTSYTVTLRALLQHRQQFLREREHPLDVQREKLGKCFIGVFREWFAPCRAGVVDEDVED